MGWQEGVLPDGRPFRVEFWARDGSSFLTFFVPAEGLDLSAEADAARYLEQAGLIRFLKREGTCCASKIKDASDNDVWSITAVVGDEYDTFIEDRLRLQQHA